MHKPKSPNQSLSIYVSSSSLSTSQSWVVLLSLCVFGALFMFLSAVRELLPKELTWLFPDENPSAWPLPQSFPFAGAGVSTAFPLPFPWAPVPDPRPESVLPYPENVDVEGSLVSVDFGLGMYGIVRKPKNNLPCGRLRGAGALERDSRVSAVTMRLLLDIKVTLN